MQVAALRFQQALPDLKALIKLADKVEWISLESAGYHSFPLVICGLMAAEEPLEFKRIVLERLQSGLGVLLVPRIKPFPIAHLLEMPEPVEVIPAEFRSIIFKNRTYRVSGSLVFRTALHAGKLADLPGVGVQLLAYRPSTAKGSIVLSGASLTSFRAGIDPEDQRLLFEQLLALLRAVGKSETDKLKDQQLSPEELLNDNPEEVALVLLARVSGAQQTTEAVESILLSLGFDYKTAKIKEILQRMLPVEPDRAIQILTKAGWGSYVRRLLDQQRIGKG